jgi:hypothetical protein
MMKIVPADDETFARERIDQLRQKRFEHIERELDPSISDPNPQDTLNKMAGMFPTEEPKSIKVVDVKFVYKQDSSTHSLTLEYEFSQIWLLVNISIKRINGLATIAAFTVTPIADSLESVNSFGLVGKSAIQYVILALAIAGPNFCLYALVVCLRTKHQNFKWIWAIFILFGVGSLVVNWTTGELNFRPLAVQILCASVTAVPAYGPWMVAVSMPLGAILFVIKRRKSAELTALRTPSAEEQPPSPFP